MEGVFINLLAKSVFDNKSGGLIVYTESLLIDLPSIIPKEWHMKLTSVTFHSTFSHDLKYETVPLVIIYKQQFLHFDWLRAYRLIPNHCKKVKLSAKLEV